MRKKFGYDVSVRLPVSTDKGGGRGETVREGNLIYLEATNRVASVKILKFLVFVYGKNYQKGPLKGLLLAWSHFGRGPGLV